MNPLNRFSEHIWTVSHPLAVAGLQLGARATIVRLPSDRVMIINPVPFEEPTKEAIDALGTVDTIVAPNLLHHLFFNDACRHWPDARALTAPGLEDKIELVERAVSMGHRGSVEDTIHWRRIEGAPKLEEHVFVDPRDEVLVISDIAFHFVDHPQWILRMMMRLNGVYGRFGPSRILRRLIDDDEAFGQSLDDLFQWPWDAIIVAHGENIDRDGRRLFVEGFERYLSSEIIYSPEILDRSNLQ